jgi:hypothetical protein
MEGVRVVPLVLFGFLAFLTFFVHSLILLVQFIVGMMTAISAKDMRALLYGSVWLIYYIPLFDFFVSFDLAILSTVFEIGSLTNTVSEIFKPRVRHSVWKRLLYLTILPVFVGLVILVVGLLGLFAPDSVFVVASFAFTLSTTVILAKVFFVLFDWAACGIDATCSMYRAVNRGGWSIRGFARAATAAFYTAAATRVDRTAPRESDQAAAAASDQAAVSGPHRAVWMEGGPRPGDLKEYEMRRSDRWKVDCIRFEWRAYTKSDVSPFRTKRHKRRDWKDWFAIVFGVVCFISLIVLDFANVASHDAKKSWMIARIIVGFLMCPFMISQNLFVFFFRHKKINKRKFTELSHAMTVARVVVLVTSLLIIAFSIYRGFFFDPTFVPDFADQELLANVTDAPEEWMCGAQMAGWWLTEFAGLCVVTHHIGDTVLQAKLLRAIVNGSVSHRPLNVNSHVPILVVNKSGNDVPVIVLQGLSSGSSLGILVENVAPHYTLLADQAAIPLYATWNSLFFEPFYRWSHYLLVRNMLGMSHLTTQAWTASLDAAKAVEAEFGRVPLFVGHASGGLLAKALAAFMNQVAVAFESPQYEDSAIGSEHGGQVPDGQVIINLLGPTNVFSYPEGKLGINMYLPEASWFPKPLNIYEVFCQVAAACVSDNRFDGLCDASVGKKTYRKYFELWHRPRDDEPAP